AAPHFLAGGTVNPEHSETVGDNEDTLVRDGRLLADRPPRREAPVKSLARKVDRVENKVLPREVSVFPVLPWRGRDPVFGLEAKQFPGGKLGNDEEITVACREGKRLGGLHRGGLDRAGLKKVLPGPLRLRAEVAAQLGQVFDGDAA